MQFIHKIFALSWVAITLIFLNSCTKTNPSPKSGNDFLIFEKDEYDLGIIDKTSSDSIIAKDFIFSNESEDSIVVESAKSSCDCTMVHFPKEPIPPGKKGMIKVKINTKHIKGKFYSQIYVLTNIENYKWILSIKGEIKQQMP